MRRFLLVCSNSRDEATFSHDFLSSILASRKTLSLRSRKPARRERLWRRVVRLEASSVDSQRRAAGRDATETVFVRGLFERVVE